MFDYNVCKLLKILGSKIQKIASQKKKKKIQKIYKV